MIIHETNVILYRPVVKLTPPAGLSSGMAYCIVTEAFRELSSEYFEEVSDFYGKEGFYYIDGAPVEDRKEAERQGHDISELLPGILPHGWKVE